MNRHTMSGSPSTPSVALPAHGNAVQLSPGHAWPPAPDAFTRAARLFVAVLVTPWMAVAGRGQRVLLAIVLLDLPLQIDKNFSYLTAPAEFGALGGFEVSLTTLALIGLYAGWLTERVVARGRPAGVPSGLVLPLGVYVAAVALSLIAARDFDLYARGMFLLVQMFFLYVYLVATVRSVEDVEFVVKWLLCGLVLESLIIIGLGLSGEGFNLAGLRGRIDVATDDVTDPTRFGGTIGSPNNAGEYLEMLLAPALVVLTTNWSRFCKLVAALGLGLGSAALIATLSRGGWIATAVSLAIVCAALWPKWLSSRAVLWLVGVAVVVTLVFHDSITTRVTADDAGSAHVRVPLMETAFRIIGDNPVLGVGANNYTAALPDYASLHRDEWIYTVHNQYLLVWAETGLVGLAALLWFLIATIRHGIDGWRRRDPLLSPLALGFTAALAGQMVHMQVDLLNARPQLQMLVTVAALLATISRMEPSRRLAPSPPGSQGNTGEYRRTLPTGVVSGFSRTGIPDSAGPAPR